MSSEALRLADALSRSIKQTDKDDNVVLTPRWTAEESESALRTQAASIASLEAERDQLRAEVERLRKPLTDEPLQVAAALRRLVVSHAHEFGDTFYFGHVASALELCPVCQGVAYDDDLKECGACNGSGKRAIEAAKEA